MAERVERRIVSSPRSALRREQALSWLMARDPAEQLLVVAPTLHAAGELLREVAAARGALFGWRRCTLAGLVSELVALSSADKGLSPVSGLSRQAVCTRAIDGLKRDARLGRFAVLADKPGLSSALAKTTADLAMAGVRGELAANDGSLEALRQRYQVELEEQKLLDPAAALEMAAELLDDSTFRHAWLGVPMLLVDCPIRSQLEGRVIVSLARRAPKLLATVVAEDPTVLATLEAGVGVAAERLDPAADGGLGGLQRGLFSGGSAQGASDDVKLVAPHTEDGECVKIARSILVEARAGLPFDRMAVLLRSPDAYRAHLTEALGRAEVPAYFSRGLEVPDPAGRSLLALLTCAREQLSARAFAEYMALGQVPKVDVDGSPPSARDLASSWISPDDEWSLGAMALEQDGGPRVDVESAANDASATEPAVRAPRRWERLLVDAAVIGSRDRWRRRLKGLERATELELAAPHIETLENVTEARRAHLLRRLADLRSLRAFALPLIDDLAALPREAPWGEWLERLAALATRALRRPERVLQILAELAPMADVGPVDLSHVRRALSQRLLTLSQAPSGSPHGRVFIGSMQEVRGLTFDVVFVPGLV